MRIEGPKLSRPLKLQFSTQHIMIRESSTAQVNGHWEVPRHKQSSTLMASSSLFMPTSLSLQRPRFSSQHHQTWDVTVSGIWRPKPFGSTNLMHWKKRRNLICAVNQDAEESFKKTVEVDRLIDKLRDANSKELQKLVVENILAFNESFWIRLAARTDTCKSDDDKKDYEELATSVMSIVDITVHKTKEKINSSTDVLKGILKPVVDDVVEIQWPPRDPESLKLMEKEITYREQEGLLDEGFLSEVNAQLRQAKVDGDKPGLEAMLQKVLQLYASTVLSKRSYAKKGDKILKAEQLLETIIKAPEEEWNKLLLNGLSLGKGEVPPQELYAVIKKRTERTLIRTEGGSYQQRVLTEYLNGIQSRAEQIIQVLEGKPQ